MHVLDHNDYLVPFLCVGEDCVGTGAGQVTVIFKDAPEQRSTDRIGHLNCVHGAIIAYVDSTGCEAGFNPRSIGYDTLEILLIFRILLNCIFPLKNSFFLM